MSSPLHITLNSIFQLKIRFNFLFLFSFVFSSFSVRSTGQKKKKGGRPVIDDSAGPLDNESIQAYQRRQRSRRCTEKKASKQRCMEEK